MPSEPRLVPYTDFRELPPEEMARRARDFAVDMARRRSVRDFVDRPVPRVLVEDCLMAAGTAPSGANQQPWHFVAVADSTLKRRIREGAEAEERAFYGGRASEEWLEALGPLGTDANKPFLETAAWLIAIFSEPFGFAPDGSRRKHYYVSESVGIATGLLITALHRAGLATLTHTPSPMGFLNTLLGRPEHERPFLLLVVGYPAEGIRVPDIARKPLEAIATIFPAAEG